MIDMSRRLQYGSKRKKHARVQVKLPAWSSRGVGKTHSGYPRGIKMRVVTWRASSAASSGPCAPIFKTHSSLKSITDGRRLSSSPRTAMRAWGIRRAGCANAMPSQHASPVSLVERRRAMSRSRSRQRRWRRPPHRRRRSRRRRGPDLWARRITPSPSTSTSLSETRAPLARGGWMGW